jgi:hypothetical protein
VNGVDPVPLGRADDLLDVEVGLERIVVGPDLVGFVGFVAVQRVTVFVGVHGHRPDVQFGGGPHDSNGNFTPVGNE